jgi:hypothetical protein
MAYSQWMQENPDAVSGAMQSMQQPQLSPYAASAQPAVAQQPSQLAAPQQPATAAPAAPQQEQPGAGQSYQQTAQIAQSIFGGGGGQPMQRPQRASMFQGGTTVQSDAPNGAYTSPKKGRAGKIMEIIGSIFSMGATKAASQAQSNSSAQG